MSLSGYLLSIAGISIATVMIEAVLPEGNMAGFVRRISALIVVFVILAPVPGLIRRQEFNFGFDGSGRSGQSTTINSDLLTIIYRQKAGQLESILTAELAESGVTARVSISVDFGEREFTVSHVSVRVDQGPRDISSIRRIVKKYIRIDDSRIFIT